MKTITAVLFAVLVLAGCASTPSPGAVTASPFPLRTVSPSIPGLPSATPAPITAHDPGMVTGGPLPGGCHTRDSGQLPDPRCTPGAYDPSVTAAVLCAPGYTTSSYRPPSSETTPVKYDVVEPAYGQDHVSGELDHLISLELGGANDLANLWVEAGPIPNAKDKVENALHGWVCSVKDPLAQVRLLMAQAAIAANWMTAKSRLGAG